MYRNPTSKFSCRSRKPNESIARYPGLNRFFKPHILKMRADGEPRSASASASASNDVRVYIMCNKSK